MKKEVKKKMWMQTVIFFIIGSAATGTIYRLFNPEPNQDYLKLIVMNVGMFAFCFLMSYFGHKTAIRKGQL